MTSRQKFGFARRGAAVVLAAALATGVMPASALAYVGSAQGGDAGVSAASAVETGDGFYLEQGKTYSLGVTYAGTGNFASMSDMVASMLTKYFGSTVDVSANGDGSYTIVVSFAEYSAAVGDITCNGSTVSQVDQQYTLTVSSIASPIDLGVKIGGAMAGMFPDGITYSMTLDTSSLPTEGPTDPGEGEMTAGETYSMPVSFAQDDGSPSMAGNMIAKNAVVVPQENGTYRVTLVVNSGAGAGYYFQALTFNGAPTDRAYDVSGNYVFTGTVEDIDQPIAVGFTYYVYAMGRGMTHGANATLSVDSREASEGVSMAGSVVKADLDAAIAAARNIEQGDKTDEAWSALQSAVGVAQSASANPAIPQVGVDGAISSLIAAVQEFKASEDVQAPAENPYGMQVGETYIAGVTYAGTGSYASESLDAVVKQMLSRYFGDSVKLRYLDNGTYDVIISFAEYSSALGDMAFNGQTITQSEDRTYVVNVPTLEDAIDLRVYIGGAMAGMFPDGVTFALDVDTASIKAESAEPGQGGDQGGGEAAVPQSPADSNTGGGSTSVNAGFQVGHTYQVPMSFSKTGTLETSMSAQYFGDTALVRPQSDGTFAVSFSTNRPDFIASLSSASYAISQSGSQYTFSMPAAEGEVVVPISMSIIPMNNMSVSADMRLSLSQAVDLGTDQENVAASSSSVLAKTGDDESLPMTVVGLAGIAAAGMALAVTRRRSSEE